MAQSIEEQFEQELGVVLITEFPSLEIPEPKWVETPYSGGHKVMELWFDKTQVWVDPISEHMIEVTLMHEDKSWSVIMEHNLIAMCYIAIGFDNYGY